MNATRLITILLIFSIHFLGLRGQNIHTIPTIEEIQDSINRKTPFFCDEYTFNAKQLILPTSLFAVGALGTFVKPYKNFNITIRNKISDLRGNCKFKADDYVQYLPTTIHLFLGFTKIPHRNTFLQRVSVDATSAISLAILTNAFKYTFREKRPDSNARNSFPSGHTATAFMGAELMRIEYGLFWGLGGYCAATAVGILRVFNERHWINDVLAGAGIGILCAHIGYWMLPLYNKWLFKKMPTENSNDKSLSFSALPSYDRYNNSFSINCIFEF